YCFIDDSSLFHLCKICELLEELELVLFEYCKYLTHVGIASAIRDKPNLKSFKISFDEFGRISFALISCRGRSSFEETSNQKMYAL
ncbi:F-box/LRR-repeat protein, partial [Trifolium medium]|nr:F-box/LRR-repeat protein [Trifolium medium]